jgi:hypothetical protein
MVKGKADKTGHIDWECVDQQKFIVALLWEYEVRPEPTDRIIITLKRLQKLESMLLLEPYHSLIR